MLPDYSFEKQIVQSSYLPQIALEVRLYNSARFQVADRSNVAVRSYDNHGTFIFRHSVQLVSIFSFGNAVGSHLCQSLDGSRNVGPFETLLQRMDHDQIDDILRISGEYGFCGPQGGL